jgi:hypothetical protein
MSGGSREAISWAFAIGNGLLAVLLCVGVFAALPQRYWVVDGSACALAGLLSLSSFGLLRSSPWRWHVLRASALCELAIGLLAIAALALGVSYLGGIHNEVGRNAWVASIAGSALLFPYLIVYPALQLLWVHARARVDNGRGRKLARE